MKLTIWTFNIINWTCCYDHLHFICTCRIKWLFQTVSSFQLTCYFHRVKARIWGLSTSKHLPTCHSICPLYRWIYMHINFTFGAVSYAHNIRFLRKYSVTHAFNCQPFYRKFHSIIFELPEVLLTGVHIHCKSKVSHFDYKSQINPRREVACMNEKQFLSGTIILCL